MSAPDTVVFLGPSLPLADARALLAADYRPPAAMGDVYAAVAGPARTRPRRIALIDGYFERMAAPWHKEILFALERGVAVYGAASMGALRAAELSTFGMIGVGEIFAAYADGRLTADDEVAVLHGPAERGYPSMSEAMVNVRAALALAETRGVISAATAAALTALAKAQFYRDRSWETVLAAGQKTGLPSGELAALTALLTTERPDAKAADARALLHHLARPEPAATTAAAAKKKPAVKLSRTWFWWRFVDVMEDRED